LTILHNFLNNSQDGGSPQASLVQGADGSFYGVTDFAGSGNSGVIFKVTSDGTYSMIHQFRDGSVSNDGADPQTALIQASDRNFYGTTVSGGSAGLGTVFSMTPQGTVTILHSFGDGSVFNDGKSPSSSLCQGIDGNFYGATRYGGSQQLGTIFKMTPQGSVTILHNFGDGTVGNDRTSVLVSDLNLIPGPDGNIYGAIENGGSNNKGMLFQISPQGTMLVLHSFGDGSISNDGFFPNDYLFLSPDGNFYGLTNGGGAGGISGNGVLFKFTVQSAPILTDGPPPAATLNTPYSFTYTALGSPAPTFSLTSGSFPPGLRSRQQECLRELRHWVVPTQAQ